MATDKTLNIRNLVFAPTEDRPARDRDRTLAGKKRIKARKEARRG